jgi:hypothetical protein
MKLTITKIDAARMQLATAIEMWFNGDNPVAVHTLACAAYQIIHDLNRKKKGPPLLFDSDYVKDQYRKEAVALLKKQSGFFKHADFRKNGATEIEFETLTSDGFILFSLVGLRYLGHKSNVYERAFWIWTFIHKPHFMTDEGRKFFFDSVSVNDIEDLRQINKKKFLEYVFEMGLPQ